MSDDAKECPFCGSETVIARDDAGWWHVSCSEHCFTSAGFPEKGEALTEMSKRHVRTCHPHAVPRTFVGDDAPSFWQAVCDCGWIVGEDGTPNLSEFEHIDNFCGQCGAKVVVDGG